MTSRFLTGLMGLLLGAAGCSPSPAPPVSPQGGASPRVLPVGEYRTYVTPADSAMADGMRKEGFLFTPEVLEAGDGYRKVALASSYTTLNVPQGWSVRENSQTATAWSASQDALVAVRWVSIAEFEDDFERAKRHLVESAAALASGPDRPEFFSLADGSFGFTLKQNAVPDSTKPLTLITVYSPSRGMPHLVLEATLAAEADRFDHYLPLFGRMLRDREVAWDIGAPDRAPALPDLSVEGGMDRDGSCWAEIEGVRYTSGAATLGYDYESFLNMSSPGRRTLALSCPLRALSGATAELGFFVFEAPFDAPVTPGAYEHTNIPHWERFPQDRGLMHAFVRIHADSVQPERIYVGRTGTLQVEEASAEAIQARFTYRARHKR